MQTLLLNINSDLNTEELVRTISMLNGVNKVEIVDDTDDDWENWTDEEETNYLLSIPGMKEVLEDTSEERLAGCVPIEVAIPGWRDNV